MDKQLSADASQEVSRVRSTEGKVDRRRNLKLELPLGKEQIQRMPLNPYYLCGWFY